MPSTTGPGSGRTRRGAPTRPAAGRSGGGSRGSSSARRTAGAGTGTGTGASSAPAPAKASEATGTRRLPTWMTHRNVRTRRAVAALAIVVVLFVPLVSTLHAWWQQRQEIEAMRETIAAQEQHVSALQQEQARWRDDAYVVQQARKRLKMVKVGETAYTVIDVDPSADADPNLAAAPAAGAHPWYGRLWESVEVADAPAAHP